jgi:hypothetical protein
MILQNCYHPETLCAAQCDARRASHGGARTICFSRRMSASLIGRLGSRAFTLFAAPVSMSLTGSCFSSESAPRPLHRGIRGGGRTIFWSACRLVVGRSKLTCELTSYGHRGPPQISQIKAEIEETTSDYGREKLQEWLAKLAGGVAVIRVGGTTEVEVKERLVPPRTPVRAHRFSPAACFCLLGAFFVSKNAHCRLEAMWSCQPNRWGLGHK